jgi:hypothetical protein
MSTANLSSFLCNYSDHHKPLSIMTNDPGNPASAPTSPSPSPSPPLRGTSDMFDRPTRTQIYVTNIELIIALSSHPERGRTTQQRIPRCKCERPSTISHRASRTTSSVYKHSWLVIVSRFTGVFGFNWSCFETSKSCRVFCHPPEP